MTYQLVTPAKAGGHLLYVQPDSTVGSWIPAFAGMTGWEIL
jgi:hypothetical protein